MYLICLHPHEMPHDEMDFRVAYSEAEAKEMAKDLAAHNPNRVIYTFKAIKKSHSKVDVTLTNYVFTDNGEVLPE